MYRLYDVQRNDRMIPTNFIDKHVLAGELEIKKHFEEYIVAEKQHVASGNTF
jgi:hypothetical protein